MADYCRHNRAVNECQAWDIVQQEIPYVRCEHQYCWILSLAWFSLSIHCLTSNHVLQIKVAISVKPFHFMNVFNKGFFPNINTVSTSFNKKNLKCLQNFKFCLIFIEAFSCLKVWSRTGSRKLTNIWDRAFSKKAIIAKGFILDAGGVLDTP